MTIRIIVERVKARMPAPDVDVSELEAELKQVRCEQRRIAKAVAQSDDIPELLDELNQRRTRIRHLEGQLEAARRDPAELAQLEARAEAHARGMIADIRTALAKAEDLRPVFASMFRDGVRFIPEWVKTRWGRRHIWRIVGPLYLDPGPLRVVTGSANFEPGADPETSVIKGSLGGGPLGWATPTIPTACWSALLV